MSDACSIGHSPLGEVLGMSVPALLGWVRELRAGDARRRRERLIEGTLAARGKPEDVQRAVNRLNAAAGEDQAPRIERASGNIDDLERMLRGA